MSSSASLEEMLHAHTKSHTQLPRRARRTAAALLYSIFFNLVTSDTSASSSSMSDPSEVELFDLNSSAHKNAVPVYSSPFVPDAKEDDDMYDIEREIGGSPKKARERPAFVFLSPTLDLDDTYEHSLARIVAPYQSQLFLASEEPDCSHYLAPILSLLGRRKNKTSCL